MAGYYDRDRRPRNAIGAPQSWDTQTPAGTMNHPTTHIGNTAEYMASGYPFITTIAVKGQTIADEDGDGVVLNDSDIIKVTFPYVTRWIIVKATNLDGTASVPIGNLHMSFSEAGAKLATCRFDVGFLTSEQRLEVKCSELFFRLTDASACTDIQIIAGLTNIPAGDFVVTTAAGTNVGVETPAPVVTVHDNAT